MFPRALRVVTLGGVDVRVDPSWLVIAALVTWSYIDRFQVDGRTLLPALGLSLTTSLLFFGSVLLHELAHAWEARSRDIEVRGITLFMLGGVTEAHLDATRARDEFALAAVGPWASLVAAAAFGLMAAGMDEFVVGWRAAAEIFGLLGWLNLGLALFNMLPGSPLDGGRVLRSIIWGATGNRRLAVRVAGAIGSGFGLLLLGWAAIDLVTPPSADTLLPRLSTIGSLWFAVIGWFMLRSSRAEVRQDRAAALFDGATVADALHAAASPFLPTVGPDESIDRVLASAEIHGFEEIVAVVDGGDTVGTLPLARARDIPVPDRQFRTASDLMTLLTEVPEVEASAPLLEALQAHGAADVVRVTSDGTTVGMLTPDRAEAWLAQRRATTGASSRTRR